MISEKIELLGKGLYKDIPDELTLKAIPTTSELDVVGAEDFNDVMLEKILPQSVEEKINFKNLLEIDFDWVCRGLRMLNYGPYYTTNMIFCSECNTTSRGEYVVDLRTIECKPLPDGFTGTVTISQDSFIDYKGDVVIALPTIQEAINAAKDKFFDVGGNHDDSLARICYTVKSMKGRNNMSPVEVKTEIEKHVSPADYRILKFEVNQLLDYGLRIGGKCQCPKCGKEAHFAAFTDDRFFRPTLGDLRKWRDDRNSGEN